MKSELIITLIEIYRQGKNLQYIIALLLLGNSVKILLNMGYKN